MNKEIEAVVQALPDFRDPALLLSTCGNFKAISAGDFVTRVSTSNGQAVTALSASPLTAGESSVLLDAAVLLPCALEIEASVSQRVRHQFSTMSLFENANAGPDVVPAPINIVSIHQSTADFGTAYTAVAGTIVTVVLETALPDSAQPGAVFLSDWVHITGLVDSRLNYQNLCIKFISRDRKTITAGFSDETALPSLAISTVTPTLGTAKLNFFNNMAGASDGAALRFTGTSATQAAVATLFAGDDVQISGTMQGSHLVNFGSSAPIYNGGAQGSYELRASSRYRIECTAREVAFLDKVSDSNNNYSIRVVRSAVKPAAQATLSPRIRLYRPAGMTRPVAKIKAISKSGSTTATVTTEDPHGLQTGEYATVKGVRDQTNFASITTAVAVTVVDAITVTLPLGSAVTATSRGGSLIRCNGGADQPGIIGQAVNQITSPLAGTADWLSITGHANWSNLAVGEYVQMHGALDDAAGTNLAVDGAWEVADISTVTLQLKPIYDVFGNRVSPPTPTLAAVNCGGTVILRTTLRAHDLMLESWQETKTSLDGQGTTRLDRAVPVRLVANDTGSTTQNVAGAAAVDAAMPNPIATGGRASNANIVAMSASGDLVAWLMTMIGAGIVKPYSIPEADWSYTGTLTTNADTAMQAAGGAGIKRYLTALQVQNTNATATTLVVKDGTTAKWTISLPASMTLPVDFVFPTPLPTSANAALNIACGTTGANVLVNAQGYTAP